MRAERALSVIALLAACADAASPSADAGSARDATVPDASAADASAADASAPDASAPDAKIEPSFVDPPLPSGARTIAFSSNRAGEFDLYLTSIDGAGLERLTADDGDDFYPAYTPDGARILFSADREGKVGLYELTLASRAVAPIDTGALARASTPAISQDGATIAFEGMRAGATDTDVFVLRGGAPVALTSSTTQDSAPAFGPDPDLLFFVSSSPEAAQIYSIHVDGTGLTRETSTTTRGLVIGRPSVSPDGRRLAFTRTDHLTGVARLMELDRASGVERVLSAANDFEPVYDADGVHLYFGTSRFGGADLMVLSLTSSAAPVQLTRHRAIEGQPALAPR